MYLSSFGGSCVLNFDVCFIFSNWHLIFLSRICIIAGNISPIDVITHVPVLCEEANIPYVYVPSKEVSLIFFSPLWLLVMLLSSLMHSLMVVYFHVCLAKRCSVGEFMNIFFFYLRSLLILRNGEIEREWKYCVSFIMTLYKWMSVLVANLFVLPSSCWSWNTVNTWCKGWCSTCWLLKLGTDSMMELLVSGPRECRSYEEANMLCSCADQAQQGRNWAGGAREVEGRVWSGCFGLIWTR